MSMNVVNIIGNLTRDPELKYTQSGRALVSVTVAVNRYYKDSAGEKKEEVTFVPCVFWGKIAEVICQHLSKGSKVAVEGSLSMNSWEKDGQKHSRLEVRGDQCHFLSSGKPNQGQSQREFTGAVAPPTPQIPVLPPAPEQNGPPTFKLPVVSAPSIPSFAGVGVGLPSVDLPPPPVDLPWETK